MEERNSHGLSLIERNEELSIIYENLKVLLYLLSCVMFVIQWVNV